MKSAIADYSEQQLIEAARKLTPEQRLAAYLEQHRLVTELYLSGERVRQEQQQRSVASSQ